MLKWIIVALVLGALVSTRFGHRPEFPSRLSERPEQLSGAPQSEPEPSAEGGIPQETALVEEMGEAELPLPTPAEATAQHPYQDLLDQGIVQPGFGEAPRPPSASDQISTPSVQAETPSAERPPEAKVPLFTENYYRLKQRLLSAIAILEGQGDGQ